MHLIFYLIENGILQIQQFLEMFRNQSKHRSNRTLIFSPESSIRGQSSQLQLKYNQPIDFVPIQKTRTFSHKKLTLTSAIPSPLLNISNEVIKKPAQPTFQVNKFYRPPIKGNPLLQSKKISTEDNKISLKVSNVDNWQVSPERTNQMSRIQSQTQIQIDKQNSIRCQIVQLIQSRFQTFLTEINSQANQINELKRKIGFLENEINAKTQKLNNLMSERLYESKKTYQNSRQQQMVGKVRDLQIEINKITWQSNKGQINVNMKLDELTNKIVKMEISKEQTQKNKLKVGLDQLVLKLNSWLNDQQKRIVKAESSLSTESILKLQQINQTFRLLSYKIQKLQEDLSNRKTESEKIMQTKDSINYWQSFEDFVISNHSHSEMPNNSIFGSDDYFFHPDSNLSFMRLKSSALCNKLRLSSTMNTNVQDASIASQESAANSFDNLVTMMEELRSKYNKELPLKCSLDKHRRIVIKQTGKLLKNEKQNSYFKISEEERRILEQRGYLKIIK